MPPSPRRPASVPRLVGRGLTRRCPKCGSGGLFGSWFTMAEACPRCGLTLDRGDAFFLGAFVINFGVTELVLAAVLAVLVATTLPHPPIGTIAVAAAAVTVVVPLLFYPFSKTVWLAVEMIMRPPVTDGTESDPARPEHLLGERRP